MKMTKRIPWWALILGLLLLIDCFWYGFAWYTRWYENANLRSAAKQIRVVAIHTNDLDGVEIMDIKSSQPLWVEWRSDHDKEPVAISYFFHGKDVFNVHLKEGRVPRYEVHFYGPQKSVTWWTDRGGSGSFTERIFYDTNGDFSRHEVWYDQAWHTAERRNEHDGIVVEGQWRQLAFDTNGMWTTETSANPGVPQTGK